MRSRLQLTGMPNTKQMKETLIMKRAKKPETNEDLTNILKSPLSSVHISQQERYDTKFNVYINK